MIRKKKVEHTKVDLDKRFSLLKNYSLKHDPFLYDVLERVIGDMKNARIGTNSL